MKLSLRSMRLACAAALVAAGAALLAACGGGTSQLEVFKPDRVIAFGDEHSTLTTTGRKYSINGLTSGALDCEVNPLWIQSVASLYGYKFSQCPGTATEFKAITRAAPGATVSDVTAQIDAMASTLTNKDMVLMMVGLNDVKAIFEGRAAGETDSQLIERARARGVALGLQVNRVVALGPRVIISTSPDLGLTPYGRAKTPAEIALLTRLSNELNARMRVTILLDGRFIGLVLGDETIQAATQVPTSFGLTDFTQAACATAFPLPTCDDAASFLVAGAGSNTWLWADSLRFGPLMHRQIGSIAATRAQTNPF